MQHVIHEQTTFGDVLAIPERFKCYEVMEVIGRGRFSIVVLVRHVVQRTFFAAKVMKRPQSHGHELERMERELRLSEMLCSPFIVKMMEIVYLPDLVCVVMEYFDCGDVLSHIMNGFSAFEPHAKVVFRQVCLAVRYLHDHDLAHRDIKPENVIVCERHDYSVKLCDFGVACECPGGLLSRTVAGTIPYVAPEVLSGNGYDAKKADIWSLGVLLYVLATGSLPFHSNDDAGLLKEINAKPVYVGHLPASLRPVVLSCCDPNPETRGTIDQILAMSLEAPETGRLRFGTAKTLIQPVITHKNGADVKGRRKTLSRIPNVRLAAIKFGNVPVPTGSFGVH